MRTHTHGRTVLLGAEAAMAAAMPGTRGMTFSQ